MASPMEALMDALVTELEAITPASDARRTYSHCDNLESLGASAASMHRRFWFEDGVGGDAQDFGDGVSLMTHQISLVMAFKSDGKNNAAGVKARISEAVKIMRAINNYSSLPSGVDYVRCTQYSVNPIDPTADEVVFSITASTRESD